MATQAPPTSTLRRTPPRRPLRDLRPGLVLFLSARSGECRRFEAALSAVLQRRRNHETFRISRVDVDERPDLVGRFRVEVVPTLLVVCEGRVLRRLSRPTSAAAIRELLGPWL